MSSLVEIGSERYKLLAMVPIFVCWICNIAAECHGSIILC